jgi:hypothetical protein
MARAPTSRGDDQQPAVAVEVTEPGHQRHAHRRRQQVDRADPVSSAAVVSYCARIPGSSGGSQPCRSPEVNSSTTRKPTAEAVPVVEGAERALQMIGIVVAFPRAASCRSSGVVCRGVVGLTGR